MIVSIQPNPTSETTRINYLGDMEEKSFKGLFEPGFHDIEMDQLEWHFARPFPNPAHRSTLLKKLRDYLAEVLSLGIPIKEIWIDGSFSTFKPRPQDVDILFVVDKVELDLMPDDLKQSFQSLLGNRGKIRFDCDAYLTTTDNIPQIAYWEDFFGRDRNRKKKGIPRIMLKGK